MASAQAVVAEGTGLFRVLDDRDVARKVTPRDASVDAQGPDAGDAFREDTDLVREDRNGDQLDELDDDDEVDEKATDITPPKYQGILPCVTLGDDCDASVPDDAPVDPFALQELDDLPVFHLTTSRAINDETYTPAELIYRGHEYKAVQAKYRGHTSLNYPKKSFTIKFDDDDLFEDAKYGFHAKRRIVLTTTYDDMSYVRQRLAFELWNRLQSRVQIGVFNAVIIRNGEYHGLFLAGDHVDDELMKASGLWKGGNLYKARTHDANLRLDDADGHPKESLELGYTKDEGEPEDGEPGAVDDLIAFVTWVATATDEQFVDAIDTTFDRRDFENWLLLVSVINAPDSAGKNGYLCHDPRAETTDALWHYAPWDFNASFGQNWRTLRIDSQEPLSNYDGANGMFERMTQIPALAERVAERYREAMQGPWALASVLELYDAHIAEIDAAARRDEKGWGASIRAFRWGREDSISYDEERAYVRNWIIERWGLVNATHATQP